MSDCRSCSIANIDSYCSCYLNWLDSMCDNSVQSVTNLASSHNELKLWWVGAEGTMAVAHHNQISSAL